MKVKAASAAEVGIRSNGGTIDRSSLVKDLSKSISVGTRKMVIYAWTGWSQGKLWWRLVAILTCKSFVWFGYRGERLIEPSSSWFPPKFPSGKILGEESECNCEVCAGMMTVKSTNLWERLHCLKKTTRSKLTHILIIIASCENNYTTELRERCSIWCTDILLCLLCVLCLREWRFSYNHLILPNPHPTSHQWVLVQRLSGCSL